MRMIPIAALLSTLLACGAQDKNGSSGESSHESPEQASDEAPADASEPKDDSSPKESDPSSPPSGEAPPKKSDAPTPEFEVPESSGEFSGLYLGQPFELHSAAMYIGTLSTGGTYRWVQIWDKAQRATVAPGYSPCVSFSPVDSGAAGNRFVSLTKLNKAGAGLVAYMRFDPYVKPLFAKNGWQFDMTLGEITADDKVSVTASVTSADATTSLSGTFEATVIDCTKL